ncbi:MAG: hypothetical protein P8X64_04040 [Anaerolineales bacterium]|jgi:hypothetical protein
MLWISYAVSFAAIVTMVINVVLAVRLRRAMIGGVIRSRWGMLTNLIIIFLLGYILSPLLLVFQLPIEYMSLLAFLVFLFGAVFVAVVIRILHDTLASLDLLEED